MEYREFIYIILYYIILYYIIWVNYNDLTATEPWNHGLF